MKIASWLAWCEIKQKRLSFFLGITMVGMIVSFPVSMELVSLIKENAVVSEIDKAGPSLRIIPRKVMLDNLARLEMNQYYLPRDTETLLQSEIARWIRMLESRLIVRVTTGQEQIPAIGIRRGTSASDLPKDFGEGETVLGYALAAKIGKRKGEIVLINDKEFTISGIRDPYDSPEDSALFLKLSDLQKLAGLPNTINEIWLFPKAGVDFDKIKALIQGLELDVNILNTTQGSVAEQEIPKTLQTYRWAIYFVTGMVVVLSVLIMSYLNARERKRELATLIAVGSSGRFAAWLIVLRALTIGLSGSILGFLIGVAIVSYQGTGFLMDWVEWFPVLTLTTLGVLGASLIGVIPVSLSHTFNDPVTILQE